MHVSLYEHELHRLVASPVIFLLAHPACAVHTHSLLLSHTNLQHFIGEAFGFRVSKPQPGADGSGGGGGDLATANFFPFSAVFKSYGIRSRYSNSLP